MPSINFLLKFATAVAMGSKCQTTRRTRKRPIKVGDTLHLFSGLRTKNCEKLFVSKCKSVQDIELYITEQWSGEPMQLYYSILIKIDGKEFNNREKIEKLVKDDGFQNPREFAKFFIEKYGQKLFKGHLIKW